MKLNIANPSQGASKKFLIEDEQKMKKLHDLRISEELKGDALGDQFKGYIFKITGGQDKDGFAMMQGVMTAERVRLLLDPTRHTCYHVHPRQKRDKATRKRKSIRGCVTSAETSVINMVIVRKGDKDIPGLTDEKATVPNRLGPKRASKIRKLWNLQKGDDVRQYVIRREIPNKEGSARKTQRVKTPKIQRLITPKVAARKRHTTLVREKQAAKSKEASAAYQKMMVARREAQRSKRVSKLSKKADAKKPEAKAAAAAPGKKAAKK